MKLHRALGVVRGDVVAFIGAGGKTSALVTLGYELAEAGWRVLATTTTRLGDDQLAFFPHATRQTRGLTDALARHQFVFLYDDVRGGKAYGVRSELIHRLLDSVNSDVLLVEADGARHLPLKAPYDHEPVIPEQTSLVVPIASMTALGQPLDDEHIYNAGAIIERYGFPEGSRIKSPWIAQVVRDEELGLKGIPEHARVVALLNGVPPTGYARARARLTARLMLRPPEGTPRLYGVAIGSVRGAAPIFEVQRRIGAVVLAAGMSKRMGQSKVLMPWQDGRSILQQILDQLMLAKVDDVLVVTGHNAREVKQQAQGAGAEVVHNPAYATGEMLSSLKAGLQALPTHVAAALIVLGDQPRLQAKTITQVMNAYAEGQGDIAAPSYQMRRGHPILIDRRYWGEILALPDGAAPRDVINNHAEQIAYVVVDDDSVVADVDTPQDYEKERQRAGLKK